MKQEIEISPGELEYIIIRHVSDKNPSLKGAKYSVRYVVHQAWGYEDQTIFSKAVLTVEMPDIKIKT